jgi:hypothetical protein
LGRFLLGIAKEWGRRDNGLVVYVHGDIVAASRGRFLFIPETGVRRVLGYDGSMTRPLRTPAYLLDRQTALAQMVADKVEADPVRAVAVVAAATALVVDLTMAPKGRTSTMLASRAAKTPGPARVIQRSPALRLGAVPRHELAHRQSFLKLHPVHRHDYALTLIRAPASTAVVAQPEIPH